MFFKDPPVKIQYCSRCGEQLKVTRFDKRFNIDTGEPESNLLWRCPNWRWYFGGWGITPFQHTSFRSDEDGNTF